MTGLKARPARRYPAGDQPVRGSLAEVAEQLHHTFGPQLTLAAAIDLARRCRRELEITSGGSTTADLVETADTE